MTVTATAIPQTSFAHSELTGISATDHVAEATQAQMEAETAGDTRVAPDMVRYSPGVAKIWANFESQGTQTIRASYNVTSIADVAVGQSDITISDDFSSANYCLVTGAAMDHSTYANQAKAAGLIEVTCTDSNHSGADVADISLVAFGDQ